MRERDTISPGYFFHSYSPPPPTKKKKYKPNAIRCVFFIFFLGQIYNYEFSKIFRLITKIVPQRYLGKRPKKKKPPFKLLWGVHGLFESWLLSLKTKKNTTSDGARKKSLRGLVDLNLYIFIDKIMT